MIIYKKWKKFSIHKKWLDLNEPVIFYVDLPEKLLDDWYKEQVRRYKNEEWKIFDIDESYELWKMSLDHILEFIKFIKKNEKEKNWN